MLDEDASLLDTEAYRQLLGMCGQRADAVPPALIAAHALRAAQVADWRVQRATMQALLRRFSAATRDELVVRSRPKGAVLGAYTTGRRGKRGGDRPYTTVLESVDPPLGSCDCRDYLRGSLGVCKHLATVLDDVWASPRRLARARKEQQKGAARDVLTWDPLWPLDGSPDLLAQVRWRRGSRPSRSQRAERVRSHFEDDGQGLLRLVPPADPADRVALVKDLQSLLRSTQAASPSPALTALLMRERTLLEQRLSQAEVLGALPKHLKGLKRKLYPYQREGVRRFLESGNLLLADDMGLGKTVQAVAGCHALFQARRVQRGLVIVPASLKSQWLNEWQATSPVPISIVEGSPAERAEQYRALRRGFVILNYERVLRDLPELRKLDADIVVLDEAQRIKNWQTKTHAYISALKPRYRLVLTGTPLENRLEELASILDWVDEFAVAPKWRLVPWHTFSDGDGEQGIAGARNLDTLRQRLAGCALRRVRQEVLSQLPPRTDTRIPVEMTAPQQVEHQELQVPIVRLMRAAQRRPLKQSEFLVLMSLLTKQRAVSNGLAQWQFDEVYPTLEHLPATESRLRSLFSPKLAELQRLVQELAVQNGRKIVVFSQWRRMLRLAHWAVRGVLAEAGLEAAFFTGAESQKQRTQSVVRFHDDPDVRVLLLTDAGGVGLNLQRAASCCINIELPWNPAVLEQRIGRIYRLGQTRPIDVFNLITEVGIEARIWDIISVKRALFAGLFDGTSDEVRFDDATSFMEDLERLIEERPDPIEAAVDELDEVEDLADDDEDLADEQKQEPIGSLSPASPSGTPSAPSAAALTDLMGALQVRRNESGGIIVEASAEAAPVLATALETVAKLLRQAAQSE